jgi:hypothetical protein
VTVTLTRPAHVATAWRIESLIRAGGVARVHEETDCLRLTVTDALSERDVDDVTHAGLDAAGLDVLTSDEAGDGADVRLYADGRLVVRTLASPPLLVVTPAGARLLPCPPLTEGQTQLAFGDIALICSSAALDHLPKGLGAALGCSPLRLAAQDPQALLTELMDDSDVGAAVVVRCQTAREQTARETRDGTARDIRVARANPTREDQP